VQQLFNSLAGLKAEQAGVGVDLQNSLRGVTQDYSGMLQSVLAPYYSAVAGTTQATTDPLAQLQAAYQAANALDQLQQGASQFAVEAALKQAGLDLQRYGIDVGASSQQAALDSSMQEALLNTQTNRYSTDVQAQTALSGQGVTSEGDQLQYGSSIYGSDKSAQSGLTNAVAQLFSGYGTSGSSGTLAGSDPAMERAIDDLNWEMHTW
jgi:hypothetical protein